VEKIEFDHAEWGMLGEKIKMENVYSVPLPSQIIAILLY